jgi:EAL and modified HD-GYP domain-containing signal transduction protein
MGLVTFVKRLFSWVAPAARPGAPAVSPTLVRTLAPALSLATAPTPQPAASPSSLVSAPAPLGLMLRRDELLDSQGRLAGYRFSARSARPGQAVSPTDYLSALQAAHVQSLAARRLAVICLTLSDWPQADFASMRAAHMVFEIDVPEHLAHTERCLNKLTRIRQSGAGVALTCVDGALPPAPALALATHALVDMACTALEPFEQQVQALQQAQPGLCLIALNVSTWPERRLCMALGVGYATGRFLATLDEQEQATRVNESRLVLLDMLGMVRHHASAQALADVAKRDPGVAVHLLSMANSPACGLRHSVTGIDQAITVLGREALYRWLTLSLFRAGKDATRDKALLEVALARARFLELAALALGGKPQADELFLVGLLSFVDALLGLPMAEVVRNMSLPAVVQGVLLHSEGPYAPYLMLGMAVEKCQAERATQLAGTLGLAPDTLNDFRNAALLWAEQAAS